MRNKDNYLNYYEILETEYKDGLNMGIFVRDEYNDDEDNWDTTIFVSLWINTITSRETGWFVQNNIKCFRYYKGGFYDVFNESALCQEYQENFDYIHKLTEDIYKELDLSDLPMDRFLDYIANQCLSIVLGFKEYDEDPIEWDYDDDDDDDND